jgi:hypothetical protein
MPRARPIFPVAISLQAASDALDVPLRLIREAVFVRGELPAYRAGSNNITRVRVRDLEQWIATTWERAAIARKIKQVSK